MSKTHSISTVYIDPPQFTTNPRKLDIRVDDVALYGAKQGNQRAQKVQNISNCIELEVEPIPSLLRKTNVAKILQKGRRSSRLRSNSNYYKCSPELRLQTDYHDD